MFIHTILIMQYFTYFYKILLILFYSQLIKNYFNPTESTANIENAIVNNLVKTLCTLWEKRIIITSKVCFKTRLDQNGAKYMHVKVQYFNNLWNSS